MAESSEIVGVLVFDDTENVYSVVDPNRTAVGILTARTGRPGGQGPPGDENVLVLEPGEELDPDTPVGPSGYKIIYRLLEE